MSTIAEDMSQEWPLTKKLFTEKFSEPGSTIIEHDLYELHARQILIDDRNFLGLFSLDTLLNNRFGQYRHDDITPKSNHPLLVFFQVQMFAKADEEERSLDKSNLYLLDRPDLDKIVALLHDEGEDIEGFSKEYLAQSIHNFINNIHDYVSQHNTDYPYMRLDFPTDKEITQMYNDVAEITDTFDTLTNGYKGKAKKSYLQYHSDILKNARATRIKILDKACNGATFVYRSQEMLKNTKGALEMYRSWVFKQIKEMENVYINHDFLQKGLMSSFNLFFKHSKGFLKAAKVKHPKSTRMIFIMENVIKDQINLYAHNIKNESNEHKLPEPSISCQEYKKLSLAPSVDLIEILQTRLEEVMRLDKDHTKETGVGMFGIQFPTKDSLICPPSPIPLINMRLA